MARTHGHGNPDWTRDETILALSLYFDCGESVPTKSDARVQELSALLRSLPYHAEAARRETFRNPDGVGFKLHNLRSVATGKGLSNTSRMDREIWHEFSSNRGKARELAEIIKASLKTQNDSTATLADEQETEEFFEGRLLTLMHKRRERHPGIRKALLDTRRKSGDVLRCELCSMKSPAIHPALEDAVFEAHHLVPLALAVERKTRLQDMALVCASCHRIIHRLIAYHRRWLSLNECGTLLSLGVDP